MREGQGPIEVPRLSREQMSKYSLSWGPGVQGREPMPQEIFVQMGFETNPKRKYPKDMAEAQAWKEGFELFDSLWPAVLEDNVETWGQDDEDKAGLRAFLETHRDKVKQFALLPVLRGEGTGDVEQDMREHAKDIAEDMWPRIKKENN